MTEPRRRAILIGSSQFKPQDPPLPPLRNAANDVDGMHEWLAAPELGAYDEIHPFKDADHHAVIAKIEDVLNDAQPDDQTLLYYSGHGLTDLPGRLYLATSNTLQQRPVSTSIAVETVRTMIELSRCKQIILILDCCYGGAAGKSFGSPKGVAEEKLKELSRGQGVYVLTASTARQTAEERASERYSQLTKHIIAGIREGKAATRNDGLIRMDDLYHYVFAQVTAEGHQEPMRFMMAGKGEDIVIARAKQAYGEAQLVAFRSSLRAAIQIIDEDVYDHAIEIIAAQEFQRDKEFFALLTLLQQGQLKPTIFEARWLRLAPHLIKQPVVSVSPPAPRVAPPALPKPAAKPPVPETKVLPATITENLNGVALEMVLVQGGKFMRGSPEGKGYDDERPQREVTVPALYVGKFQVTQAQWKAVMGQFPKEPGFPGEQHPVERVSWHDAQAFCQKLSQMTGKAYRLPSEAEWEFACRAGTTGDYAGKLDEMAWYSNNSDGKTHPVGQKSPNAFGLFDMHGNVWEWCEDHWHGDYNGAPTDGSAWIEQDKGAARVVRGGSWNNVNNFCRSASRSNNDPAVRYVVIGFRVVISARTLTL
jgi:formylglycine-generating enzyme required for sulfatase activity